MLFMYFKTATAHTRGSLHSPKADWAFEQYQAPLLAHAAIWTHDNAVSLVTEAITMKRLGISSTALWLLLFGAASLTLAQQDQPTQHEQKDKTAHQAQPARQAQPAQHRPEAPSTQAATPTQPLTTTKRASQTQPTKPSAQHSLPANSTLRTSPSSRSAAATHPQPTQNVRRSQQAHNFGGHGDGHITSARFTASFGSSHQFRSEQRNGGWLAPARSKLTP